MRKRVPPLRPSKPLVALTALIGVGLLIIALANTHRAGWVVFTVFALGMLWWSTTEDFRRTTKRIVTFYVGDNRFSRGYAAVFRPLFRLCTAGFVVIGILAGTGAVH